MNLLDYSNGWGHLVMSALFAAIGLTLILVPWTDATTKSIGVSLLLTVSAAWFVPGAAKQISSDITKQIQQLQPPTTTPPAA